MSKWSSCFFGNNIQLTVPKKLLPAVGHEQRSAMNCVITVKRSVKCLMRVHTNDRAAERQIKSYPVEMLN